MNIGVPSRFACLKIEDDERKPAIDNADKKKNGNNNAKLPNTKKVSNQKPSTNNGATANNKKSSTNSKKQKTQQSDKQWEDWKKMDTALTTENYEEDLRNAILQSKLDYEQQKINDLKSNQTTTNNKKKKSKTMYLDQFLDDSKPKIIENSRKHVASIDDEKFYDKIKEIAKLEVRKTMVEEERREREVEADKIVTIAQFQAKLIKERARNENLQQQLDKARAEIIDIKARNKTLCGILGQGEMKEKADILLELRQVNIDKNDLTEEISLLTKLLEQERSKSASISETQSVTNTFKHKEQKVKKTKKKGR